MKEVYWRVKSSGIRQSKILNIGWFRGERVKNASVHVSDHISLLLTEN